MIDAVFHAFRFTCTESLTYSTAKLKIQLDLHQTDGEYLFSSLSETKDTQNACLQSDARAPLPDIKSLQ